MSSFSLDVLNCRLYRIHNSKIGTIYGDKTIQAQVHCSRWDVGDCMHVAIAAVNSEINAPLYPKCFKVLMARVHCCNGVASSGVESSGRLRLQRWVGRHHQAGGQTHSTVGGLLEVNGQTPSRRWTDSSKSAGRLFQDEAQTLPGRSADSSRSVGKFLEEWAANSSNLVGRLFRVGGRRAGLIKIDPQTLSSRWADSPRRVETYTENDSMS
jgi:hypothetical protein